MLPVAYIYNLLESGTVFLCLVAAAPCFCLSARSPLGGRRFAPPPPPVPSCRCSPDTPSLSPLLGFMCHVHARRMVPRPGLANKFAAHFLWHVPICSASLLCKLHATVGAGPAAARKATVLTSKVARQRSSWFATQPPWSGKA